MMLARGFEIIYNESSWEETSASSIRGKRISQYLFYEHKKFLTVRRMALRTSRFISSQSAGGIFCLNISVGGEASENRAAEERQIETRSMSSFQGKIRANYINEIPLSVKLRKEEKRICMRLKYRINISINTGIRKNC